MKKSKMYDTLAYFFTTLSPGIYIMYAMGVFEEGFVQSTTKVSTGIYVGLAFILYQTLKMYQRRINDKDNPNIKHKGIAAGIKHATPWILVGILTGLVYFGVSSIARHAGIIISLELLGSVCIAKAKYWHLKEAILEKENKDD